MKMTSRTKSEYGGYLPLELNPGQEYFSEYEDVLYRFNSVKAALAALIGKLRTQEIYIPYYYCPSTTAAIADTGIEVNYYHIGESLLPTTIPDRADSIVLLVDYFGVCGDKITELAHSFANADVIIDRAHAFYVSPVISERIHNVYSAKKFFGVPDGAYLISKADISTQSAPSCSYEYAGYLIKSYEKGTNAAYDMKKDADRILAGSYSSMSKLARGLLENADYDRVQKARVANYNLLRDLCREMNELEIESGKCAYMFPLLIPRVGRVVKQRLINERIFVPTLWKGEELDIYGSAFEKNMRDDALFLPVDQRYDEPDMRYMVDCIQRVLGELG